MVSENRLSVAVAAGLLIMSAAATASSHLDPNMAMNDELCSNRPQTLVVGATDRWLPKIWSRFGIFTFSHEEGGFYTIVKNGV